jgi:hypothetical protein
VIGKSGVPLLPITLGFISGLLRSPRTNSTQGLERSAAALMRAFLLAFLHAFLQSFEALTYRSQGQQGDSHRIRQF